MIDLQMYNRETATQKIYYNETALYYINDIAMRESNMHIFEAMESYEKSRYTTIFQVVYKNTVNKATNRHYRKEIARKELCYSLPY